MAYNPESIDQIQYDALWEVLSNNPLLPSSPVPALNKQLTTSSKSIIKAINELKSGLTTTNNSSTTFNSFYNELFGDVFKDKTLSDNIKLIDENVLKAVFKTYSTIVGDPNDPVDVTELGDNVNQCLLFLKDLIDSKDAEINELKTAIENVDEISEAIASEDMEAFKIVYMNDAGELGIADCGNSDNCDDIIGITMESVSAGENVKYCTGGELTNPNWNFEIKGTNLFVGNNGDISESPIQDSKFIQQIGFIVETNVIKIDIKEGIVIG